MTIILFRFPFLVYRNVINQTHLIDMFALSTTSKKAHSIIKSCLSQKTYFLAYNIGDLFRLSEYYNNRETDIISFECNGGVEEVEANDGPWYHSWRLSNQEIVRMKAHVRRGEGGATYYSTMELYWGADEDEKWRAIDALLAHMISLFPKIMMELNVNTLDGFRNTLALTREAVLRNVWVNERFREEEEEQEQEEEAEEEQEQEEEAEEEQEQEDEEEMEEEQEVEAEEEENDDLVTFTMNECRDVKSLRVYCRTSEDFEYFSESDTPFTCDILKLEYGRWVGRDHIINLFFHCKSVEIKRCSFDDIGLTRIFRMWMRTDAPLENLNIMAEDDFYRRKTLVNVVGRRLQGAQVVRKARLTNLAGSDGYDSDSDSDSGRKRYVATFLEGRCYQIQQQSGKKALIYQTDYYVALTVHFEVGDEVDKAEAVYEQNEDGLRRIRAVNIDPDSDSSGDSG